MPRLPSTMPRTWRYRSRCLGVLWRSPPLPRTWRYRSRYSGRSWHAVALTAPPSDPAVRCRSCLEFDTPRLSPPRHDAISSPVHSPRSVDRASSGACPPGYAWPLAGASTERGGTQALGTPPLAPKSTTPTDHPTDLATPVPRLRWILACRGSHRPCNGPGDTGPETEVDPGTPRLPPPLPRTWRHRSRDLGGSWHAAAPTAPPSDLAVLFGFWHAAAPTTPHDAISGPVHSPRSVNRASSGACPWGTRGPLPGRARKGADHRPLGLLLLRQNNTAHRLPGCPIHFAVPSREVHRGWVVRGRSPIRTTCHVTSLSSSPAKCKRASFHHGSGRSRATSRSSDC